MTNSTARLRRIAVLAVAALGTCMLTALPATADTAHSLAYGINTNGGIAVAANTSMRCDVTSAACTAALDGTATGSNLNNNRFNGVYVDVDSDATTFSSSSAQLTIPAGSTVLYALLTWGGDSTNAGRNTVRMETPAGGGYSTVTAGTLATSAGNSYAGWTDITAQVQAAGSGTYTIANVRGDVGKTDSYAGWQIVVAYRDPAAPARNLAVFTGYKQISSSIGGSATININGFQTPAVGDVNAGVTVLGFEGDLGLTGDRLQLEGNNLTDAANPATNAFNSSITRDGSYITDRSPTDVNTLGVDSDTFITTNAIANNAIDADLTLTTTNDVYNVATVAVATDLYAPDIEVDKTAVDINGGLVEANDVVEYQMIVTNNGTDGADDVVLSDFIPDHTTYEAGTLKVTQPGGTSTAQTDAAADDQGEYSTTGGNHIIAYLGAGATSSSGGLIASGETATVVFRVRIDPALTAGGEILNTATVTSTGQTVTSATYEDASNYLLSVQGHAITEPDLVLDILQNELTMTAGSRGTFTIVVVNQGNGSAVNAVVTGDLDTRVSAMSISGSPGSCTVNRTLGTFSCNIGTLGVGESVTLQVALRLPAAGTHTFNATTSTPTSEMLLTNNDDTLPIEVLSGTSTLATQVVPNRHVIQAGDPVKMTATLTNIDSATATRPELCVTIPAGFSVVRRGGGSLRNGQLCWSWSSLAPSASRRVNYTLRASTTARSGKVRFPQSRGNATNAGGVSDATWLRIVGGTSGTEAVTG